MTLMRMQISKKNRFALAALCGSLIIILGLSSAVFAQDIVIYGDTQGQHNEDAQRKVVQAILRIKPSIIFMTGDLVPDGNNPKDWERFNDITGPLLKTTEYFPALGNHERDSPLYFANFPFLHGRRWYSVEREGIHFTILDSNSDLRPESAQYDWLVSNLQGIEDSVKFRVVIFHHPLFCTRREYDDEKGLRPILMPLFSKYGVSAVFFGHEHNYEHFEYEGIFFIVTAGGGAALRDRKTASPYLKAFKKAYHFCLLTPEKDFLRVTVYGIDLNVIDDFKIPARHFGSEKNFVPRQREKVLIRR